MLQASLLSTAAAYPGPTQSGLGNQIIHRQD
jgi:hypothetical protein